MLKLLRTLVSILILRRVPSDFRNMNQSLEAAVNSTFAVDDSTTTFRPPPVGKTWEEISLEDR